MSVQGPIKLIFQEDVLKQCVKCGQDYVTKFPKEDMCAECTYIEEQTSNRIKAVGFRSL